MVRCVNPERLKFEVEYGMNRGGAECRERSPRHLPHLKPSRIELQNIL